ncbi:DNA replication and repair protein RecO [Filimonas lacunae]|uniref:DNA repair protein RecO n=1 Tax=Filimonas lacunae TaxID=477680 RepID=A0A173MQJ6_9BACT|nr:DNA repair protein RecO [Filimonas lacunae]BAV09932.1 DNA recombination and repair protein RecO [Filimonas lacunae]SIS81276.1 DNA replication and repair protein RecO [Filimonas lacunae]
MTHATKGIVLRTVKYGETSIIASVYTELFGLQSYMVKGVRQSSKKSQGKAGLFQPGAILQMEVYHNEFKHLHFIREYDWAYLYDKVFFNVVRNAVAMYVIEVVQHSLKQPEANPELFYLIEDTLKQLDRGADTLVANLPIYFTLHLGSELGFQLQGEFSKRTPVLDLQEGMFTAEPPTHPYFVSGETAAFASRINSIQFYNDLEDIHMSRFHRRDLLENLQHYIALHVTDFGTLRSLEILQEVLA